MMGTEPRQFPWPLVVVVGALALAAGYGLRSAEFHQERQQESQPRSLDRQHQDPRCAEAGDFPADGVVGSEAIAKDVAYRYLKSVYLDDRHIRPMRATLKSGVWAVRGTLPEGWIGGVAEIDLCQSNGRVLTIAHGQ